VAEPQSPQAVIAEHDLEAFRARLEALDAQRICLRITDKHWGILKDRARKSPRPLDAALQSELNRCAHAIRDHYVRALFGHM
jgi:hypothetical protein